MDLSKIIEWVKLPTKVWVTIATACALVLFTDDNFNDFLGIKEFVKLYRPYIGVIFLVSFVFTIVNVSEYNWKKFRRWSNTRNRIKYTKKRLHNLTEGERKILRYFLLNNSHSQQILLDDGDAKELEVYKIISRSSSIGSLTYGFTFNIQPWAWDYLHKHPELILSYDELKTFQQ